MRDGEREGGRENGQKKIIKWEKEEQVQVVPVVVGLGVGGRLEKRSR